MKKPYFIIIIIIVVVVVVVVVVVLYLTSVKIQVNDKSDYKSHSLH